MTPWTKKLAIYNFGTGTRKWFKDYLAFRTQYVSIGSKRSDMKYVRHGSVIGPILYSLYINEMPSILRNPGCRDPLHRHNPELLFPANCPTCPQIPSFADDASVITSSNSSTKNQQDLIDNLAKIKTFLNSNNLTMNESKTNVVEIMVPQKRANIRGVPPFFGHNLS